VSLCRVEVGIADIFIDQSEQQLFLRCIEIAGREAFEPAQAVASANTCQNVRKNRFFR
jgi:hypothetical protein